MRTTLKPDDLVTTVAGLPATMDTLRRTQVQQLATAHDAERAALDIEQKRLAAKYGAESPQAKAATARLGFLDQARAAISAEILRETIAVPKVNAGEFIVYGRILTADGSAAPGATVTAVEGGGQAIASAASADLGVFELHVPVAQQSAQGLTGSGSVAAFQLDVSFSNIRTPFRYAEVFQPIGGRLAYREITLPASMGKPPSTSCGPSSQPLYTW
jgi:hypothetical protein